MSKQTLRSQTTNNSALSILDMVFALMLMGMPAGMGCGKEPPTSTAPATLKNINVEELNKKNAAGQNDDLDDDFDDDDDDDDDDDGSDDSGPIINPRFGNTGARPTGTNKTPPNGAGNKNPPQAHSQNFGTTINGHPKGPKAEVFNGIINSSFPRVNKCFAAQINKLRPGKSSIKVRIKVANSGSVKESKILSGINNEAVRSCVVQTLKSLKFPAFQGSEIQQVVPFNFISR